ncbi:MAG TPA: peptidoglycan DD-metalloendopeptidase family protein [Gaiella sp.]|jgi:murein DD-endopeptidase MepM/ murein hydrolase activator NlpD
MSRRAALVIAALALLLAAAPAGGDPGSEKAALDARIAALRLQLAEANATEGVLTSQLSTLTGQVREVEAAVAAEEARLSQVEAELASQRARRERLDERVAELAARLDVLRREEQVAVARLERRVREIYMADEPDPMSFVVGATSFADLIDNVELLNRIGRQDERIAARVKRTRTATAAAEAEARDARAEALEVERTVAARAEEQRVVRDRLVASRNTLASAQDLKQTTLASLQEDQAEFLHEVAGLEAQSAALAAQIRAAGSSSIPDAGAPPSSPGAILGWPVGGPVVSGFGPRWGRMHEGIDIACASGTPVHAAASGTVIHAGWLGGYGLLVVVDHGNGLSTAYAHNSSLAVGVGQSVAQGQVLSLAGSTGNSSGPHVHFEVRVDGSAVDPLGYL